MQSRFPRPRMLVGLLLTALLVTGCTNVIAGQAGKVGTASTVDTGRSGPKSAVAPADIAVTDDGHTAEDSAAKNTVADLYTFYTAEFPKQFGKSFVKAHELKSYDSRRSGSTVCGRSLYKSVNASYNPKCDTIVWDRGVLLPEMTDDVGPLGAPTILAHEMGHLVQNRLGVSMSGLSRVIMLEQQADCYAGAYWRWVADGNSTYFDLNQSAGVREVLAAMMSTADPVGISPSAQQAHGSGFDRTFAFSLGFTNGMLRCSKIDENEVNNRIQETGFTVIPSNFGNVEITDELLQKIGALLNSYYSIHFKGYQPPALKSGNDANASACPGVADGPINFCQATNTVNYSLPALKKIGTPTEAGFSSKSGDFSAIILVASRYALAAEATGGATTTGDVSGLRALCYAGTWASWMRQPQGGLSLSPNDLDKAVYQVMSSPLAASDSAGATTTRVIDQVQALYIGVVYKSTEKCFDFYSAGT